MTIPATLTPADYIKAQRLQLRRMLLRNIAMAWVAFVIVPALTIYCIWQLVSPPPEGINWMPFVIVGIACIQPVFYWYLLPRQIHKAFATQEWLREPKEIRIDAKGIVIKGSQGAFTKDWAEFLKYEFHPEIVFVYETGRNYHIFPKHWFKEEEYAEFQEILKAALGTRKGSRP